jgi:hypothetical protein
MDAAYIQTSSQFREFMIVIAQSQAKNYQGSLEKYLCSLLSLVQESKNQKASWRLFAELFIKAFSNTPISFDEDWLNYKSPPMMILMRQPPQKDGIEELQEILFYQIADLHRMEQAGYFKNDEIMRELWFGEKKSPTGFKWSNFTPDSFLESMNYGLSENSNVTECSWTDLAIVLWLGQIYE